MASLNCYARKYEALDIVGLSQLTSKQYLVYAYLMSISLWNGQNSEGHYYVYKNSFTVKDAAAFLKISENTWRSAIRELRRHHYIWYECDPEEEKIDDISKRKMKEKKGTKYYIIHAPSKYVPLDINLIKVLVRYGSSLQKAGGGGNIVSVYSMICRYWEFCQTKAKVDRHCYLTISQIRKVFCQKRTQETGDTYRLMIALFQFLGLVEVKTSKEFYKGVEYLRYEFINPKYKIDERFYLEEEEGEPDDIEDILKAIKEEVAEQDIEN